MKKYGPQFISESKTLNTSVWLGVFFGIFFQTYQPGTNIESMGSAGDTDTEDFKKF